MKKSILFLSMIVLMSLSSCSSKGAFELYFKEVDRETFIQNFVLEKQALDFNTNSSIEDFVYDEYSYSSKTQTVTYENGNKIKLDQEIESSFKGRYDKKNDAYLEKNNISSSNTSKGVSTKIEGEIEYIYQNIGLDLYIVDKTNKLYELNASNHTCNEMLNVKFSDFLWNAELDAKKNYSIETSNAFKHYQDKKTFTMIYEFKNEENENFYNVKQVKQFMFTNERCFYYSETRLENVIFEDGVKIAISTYDYFKYEYNFKNVSVKPVDLKEYNQGDI